MRHSTHYFIFERQFIRFYYRILNFKLISCYDKLLPNIDTFPHRIEKISDPASCLLLSTKLTSLINIYEFLLATKLCSQQCLPRSLIPSFGIRSMTYLNDAYTVVHYDFVGSNSTWSYVR